MAEYVGNSEALHESEPDHGRVAFFLPSAPSGLNSIHVSEELSAHVNAVRILEWQLHEARRCLSVTFALKYPRLMSMKLSCIQRLDFGSQINCHLGPHLVMGILGTVRIASSGSAGAK